MRRDALENQERILAAALTTMLRDGWQVPMSVIASEAGVGVGTLYRKYPNREELLGALTERAFVLLADIAAGAGRHEGSGLAQLNRWWDDIIEVHDQLVRLPLHSGPSTLSPAAVTAQRHLHRSLRGIIATGKRDGSLRDDLTLHDVIYFGVMLVIPFPGPPDWRRVALRQKEIHLAGLGTDGAGSVRR